MPKLDEEERELLRSFEAGEWTSVPDRDEEVRRYRGYARETFRKDRRINIRISSRDLDALQKKALVEGIPYQTLVTSVLHKYAAGRLREEKA
jgi:predicted DNA binding CopG/RHH family protein